MLTFFRSKSNPRKIAAEKLYSSLVTQARMPIFYSEWNVPDTLDGRFDMVLLHAFIVMHRLVGGGKEAEEVSQALYDVIFVDMDRAVREMGIGDLSVKRHIRRMMKAFNGRVAAYEQGVADPSTLHDAVRRNVYGTIAEDVSTLAMEDYILRCMSAMQAMPVQAVVEGRVIWPTLSHRQSA